MALLMMLALPTPLPAAGPLGVVLLHGKNGAPDGEEMLPISYALVQAGFLVETPEMPWSWIRLYDATFDEALTEINDACQRLRTQGAQGLVVAGQGLGANAALAYAAGHPGLKAVMALAPSHTPELPSFREPIASEVAKARGLVARGQGEEPDQFEDLERGHPFKIQAPARVYLSYVDPDGAAVMPRNVARLPAGTALLWVISREDILFPRGQDYAFALAPANPHNRFLVVNAAPEQTAIQAVEAVVAWLKGLGD